MIKVMTGHNLHHRRRQATPHVIKIMVRQNKGHDTNTITDLPFEKKHMISVTGVTGNYVLQPALLEKHTRTLAWLSATALWKSELTFFQKQLEAQGALHLTNEDRREVDHFQNVVLFYNVELIEDIRKKLRNHESKLARMLETKSEWETQYYTEHNALMDEAEELSTRFEKMKTGLKALIVRLGEESPKA
jgi:hypothetical protein